MAIPFSNAAAAYTNAATRGLNVPGGRAAAPTDGPSFGDMLEEAVSQSVQTMRTGEEMTAKGVVGKADLADVVNAVTNAEVTLQAVVSVRDKVISAYQEILRMPM
ncbi:flagellar hook-basal body complex protein FliE [Niveispirillum fermenti]|uniref:flagellar hook-basal body complex protein FliE n=1 Tax=Niveispirillum fermenti TaxID=1233113 RepID=UPI003A8BA841